LVSPPTGKSQLGKVPMPPLGLASLAAVLERDGHRVEILDCVLAGLDFSALEREIDRRRPDLVGITGTTWTRYEQFKAAAASKRARPDVPVVLGGPHVTFTAANTLERLPQVDFVVKGEGEVALARLVGALGDQAALRQIPSLALRHNGEVIDNPVDHFVEDLDSLPLPARHLLDIPAYRQQLFGEPATTVMSSRGCPVFCSFCSTSVMWGVHHRRRSPALVVREVAELIDRYGLKAIWFFDDTLTLNRRHIVGILEEIERQKLDFRWYCEIRANTVDRDLLAWMQARGCRFVSFGVETGSPRMLKRIHKGVSLDQVRRVVGWCEELDLYTKAFFILGLPDETVEDGRLTVQLMTELRSRIDEVALSVGCSIMPGTEVERFALANGLLPADFDWAEERYWLENRTSNRPVAIPTLYQPQLGVRELNQLKYEYYGARALHWRNVRDRVASITSVADLWRVARLGAMLTKVLAARALPRPARKN